MLPRRSTIRMAAAGLLFMVGGAQALTIRPFTTAEFAVAQNAGAAVAVHFRPDWCPTCRAQDQAFKLLRSGPALDNVTLLLADYDLEKATNRQISMRSQATVVVFKGKTEVAREAGTINPGELKVLLRSAL